MSEQDRVRHSSRQYPARRLPTWGGYVVAVAAMVLLTLALDALRMVFPGVLILIPYILVTMGVAYFFGLGPAVLSIVLAAFSQSYVYIPPPHHIWPFGRTQGEWVRFWFLIGGLAAAGWATLSVRKLTLALREEVAEHVRAEEALTESRHDLARAQEIAHIGSWRLDVRRNELTWSDEVYDIFGVERGTPLTYESFLSFVHPENREYVDREWTAALRGETYDIEHRIVLPDGSVKWVRETAELEFAADGELLGGFGTVQDITETVRLRKELERDRERFAALYSVAEAGISTQSIEDVVGALATRMREAMHTHACAIFTYDEEQGEFVGQAESNVPGLVGTRLDASKGLADVLRRERKPVYSPDAEHDTALQDKGLRGRHVRAMLAVPLIVRGRLIGMVRVEECEPREFSPEEVELLEVMAARAALIIGNAQLLESLTMNYRLLQRALLPPSPPDIQGYRIATTYLPGARGAEIGGDFYDIFLTEDQHLAVLIGDVTGKGIPSASLAAATRSTLRAFAYDTSNPGESLRHTNAVVSSEVRDVSLFVTTLVTVVDYHTGRVRYSSAGHPAPAIWHKATGEVEFARHGNPPVGITPSFWFEEHEVMLSPGDKIVFYTDGLSEARHNAELFGQERISEILHEVGVRSPEDVVSALTDAACAFSHQTLRDDMAIVVVEREKAP